MFCLLVTMENIMNAIRKNGDGHVGKEYADPYGQGRITVLE